jgi:hypothetical protein
MMYKSIFLQFVLYGCELCLLTLMEERKLHLDSKCF